MRSIFNFKRILSTLSMILLASYLIYQLRELKLDNRDLQHKMNRLLDRISYINKKEALLQSNLHLLNKIHSKNIYSDSPQSAFAIDEQSYEQFHIINPHLVISDVSFEQPQDILNIKVIKHKIYMSFDTISDENIFNFIQYIEQEITGFVMITSLKIYKIRDIDESIITQYEAGHLIPTVNAQIAFDLYQLLNDQNE